MLFLLMKYTFFVYSCINTEKLHRTDKNINGIQLKYSFFVYKADNKIFSVCVRDSENLRVAGAKHFFATIGDRNYGAAGENLGNFRHRPPNFCHSTFALSYPSPLHTFPPPLYMKMGDLKKFTERVAPPYRYAGSNYFSMLQETYNFLVLIQYIE